MVKLMNSWVKFFDNFMLQSNKVKKKYGVTQVGFEVSNQKNMQSFL